MFARLVTSCQQVWNKLLTTCNNLVDIVRLVTRLFQQGCYNHDIYKPVLSTCNILVISWLYQLVRTTLLQVIKSLLQVVNNLFQTCYNKLGQAVRTQLVDNLWTDLLQLVCRLVTTCVFLRVYIITFRKTVGQNHRDQCSKYRKHENEAIG